jgi:integrase
MQSNTPATKPTTAAESNHEGDLPYVPSVSEEFLNHRQRLDYNEHRRALIEWLDTRGKDPDKHKGYSEQVVSNYAYRIDKFYRWVWNTHGRYTTQITHEHAHKYIDAFAKDELRKENGGTYSGSHKRKTANAIEAMFEWRARERGGERWSPDVTFSEGPANQADPFDKQEQRMLREAALELDTIPAYNDLSPDERDRWKAYLAQKLGKPKGDVSPSDWDRLNKSWELPSLILTALDTGMRPVGFERIEMDWLRLDEGVIKVPTSEIIKDGANTQMVLREQTVKALRRWKEERENYAKYDDSNAVWLNRKGNRYNSNTLNYLLNKLCEEAGISQENRNISFYSIRRTVGTYLITEGDLAQAQAQLRHKKPSSTMRYAESPPEERRSTLDKF